MPAEIIARLSVDSRTLSAGINAGFAEVEARSKSSAAAVEGSYSSTYRSLTGTAKREFAQAFREINNLATSAAGQISGAAGGGFDAGNARAAANASRERTEALQGFVTAASAASRSVQGLTRDEQLYISAAQAALLQSVQETNVLNGKANALERLTGGLGQTAAAQNRTRVSAGQMQSGMQQLGFQVSDVAQGLSQKGVSAMTVFAQQAPQVIQAIQLMTNKSTGFIGALAGWPGIIGVAAISLGYGLYNAMNKSGDGADKLGEKEQSLTDRIREQNSELTRNIQLQGQRLTGSLQEAQATETRKQFEIFGLEGALRDLKKQLKTQKLIENDARFSNDPSAIGAAQSETARLKAEISELNKKIADEREIKAQASQNIRAAQVAISDRQIAGNLDPLIAATNKLEAAQAKLNAAFLAGDITLKTRDAKAEELLRRHQKEKAAIEETTKARAGANKEAEKQARLSQFISPVNLGARGVRISSEQGERVHPISGKTKFHAGRDIAAPAGTPVSAAADGTVIRVGKLAGYGNVVIVEHGGGISTKYAHLLDQGDVKVGDRVSQGQQIARVGSTGNSTGNHLHYEVRQGDPLKGRPLNPALGRYAIDPEGASASAEAQQAEQAAREAAREAERFVKDRAEALERINSGLAQEATQLSHNARIEQFRRDGLDVEADKAQAIFELRARYSDLIANDQNLNAADRVELEKKLAVTERQIAADVERRAAAEAAQAANDNSKRIRADIDGDIGEEQERQRLDALRLAGLTAQAEKEYAILQYRQRYTDLLKGAPEDAAKLLKITTEQVIAERARLKESEALILQGIDQEQQRSDIDSLSDYYERAFASGGKSIWDDFKAQGRSAISNLLAQWTIGLLRRQSAGGGGVGSFFANLLGGGSGSSAQTGGSLGVSGGGLSSILGGSAALGPAAIAVGVNQAISSALGNDQIKNGGILSLVIGPFLTSFFGSAKKGSATLGFNNGSLGAVGVSGNDSARRQAASAGVNQLATTLEDVAAQLGGTVSGAGSVSIGVRKKKFVVDTSGRGRTKGAGVLSFDTEKEAIEAAFRDALSDGVIAGISAASQRIISSGQDLQKALQKALLIENIPKALKSRLNPVGAALDSLNDKWQRTIEALREGAASAEQWADARKLYDLERADILTGANDNIKDFINSLNFGTSSAYSLVDQYYSARQAVDPDLANIRSGNFGAVNQDRYLSNAGEVIQIQRELEGSGPAFFATVDEFRNASQALADGLAAQQNARDLFAELTATGSQATAQNTQATAEILAAQSILLSDINLQLSRIGGGGGSLAQSLGFVGDDRQFVATR